jgi:hypothetical protein
MFITHLHIFWTNNFTKTSVVIYFKSEGFRRQTHQWFYEFRFEVALHILETVDKLK